MRTHLAYGTAFHGDRDDQGVWLTPVADCSCGWGWKGEPEFAFFGDAYVLTSAAVVYRAADMAEHHRVGNTDREPMQMDVPLSERGLEPFYLRPPGEGKTSLIAKAFPSRWARLKMRVRGWLS